MYQEVVYLTELKFAVLILHRFSAIRKAYRILVPDIGELVEFETHEELLTKDGRCAEFFNLQAVGYQ